jgi:SNF2 family DNA or RNA helicase
MIVRPSVPVSEIVARLSFTTRSIRVVYAERCEAFNAVVKGWGCYWVAPGWTRNLGNLNGTAEDRAAELGRLLLSENYVVEFPTEELAQKALAGDYEPECPRWLLVGKGEYAGWFRLYWKKPEDFYHQARRIAGSQYDPLTYCVVVPSAQFAQVLDFAQLYDFRQTEAAQKLLEMARGQKEQALVADVVMPNTKAEEWQRPVLQTTDVGPVPPELQDTVPWEFGLTTTLLPHQEPAVEKMRPLRVGALFMDMGTGKTRCAIELAYLRRARLSNVVWFCPVGLKETVAVEIRKHTNAAASAIYSFDEHTSGDTLPPARWYLIGTESMSNSDRVILAADRIIGADSMVVMDESDMIRTYDAKRTEWITRIAARARYRLCLTGTPMSQGVQDLFAQLYFLDPRILGYQSFYSFMANHLEYSADYPNMVVRAHNTDWLAAKMQPYVYQITKEEAGLNLPPKLYDRRYFALTEEQSYAYEQVKWDLLINEQGDMLDPYVIFQLFTALQQITSGFLYRGDKVTEFPCRRWGELQNIISRLPDTERVIIWVKYRHSVEVIRQGLTERYAANAVALLHGELTEEQRSAELTRFREEARFLVATMATGGRGLTLNEAAYSVFYENDFKYANRLQAEDRNHRIGQMRRPTYIDIVSRSGIEERIMESLEKKGNVVESFRRKIKQLKKMTASEVRDHVKAVL